MRKRDLVRVAAHIKFLALDGDGVIFPNDAWEAFTIGGVSLKPKTRSHYDGQGLSFLRGIGVRICIITNAEGEDGRAARELVERWNNLPSCTAGKFAKVELLAGYDGPGKRTALENWLKTHGGNLAACAVMGNDIGDWWMLKAASVAACPIDAEPAIARISQYVSDRPGGRGAVRDLCNFILAAKRIDPTTLPLK